jgi:hypothetical protein
MKKRLAKQFLKDGQIELMLKNRRARVLMYRGALETERKKSTGYQKLLDGQLVEIAKLQRRLDSSNDWVRKHPNDPKGAERQKQLNDARSELRDIRQRHQQTLKYNGQLHQELDQLKLAGAQRRAKEELDQQKLFTAAGDTAE